MIGKMVGKMKIEKLYDENYERQTSKFFGENEKHDFFDRKTFLEKKQLSNVNFEGTNTQFGTLKANSEWSMMETLRKKNRLKMFRQKLCKAF